jgi:hypothetical protein
MSRGNYLRLWVQWEPEDAFFIGKYDSGTKKKSIAFVDMEDNPVPVSYVDTSVPVRVQGVVMQGDLGVFHYRAKFMYEDFVVPANDRTWYADITHPPITIVESPFTMTFDGDRCSVTPTAGNWDAWNITPGHATCWLAYGLPMNAPMGGQGGGTIVPAMPSWGIPALSGSLAGNISTILAQGWQRVYLFFGADRLDGSGTDYAPVVQYP